MVLTKDELIGCLQKEVHILLHLCGKVEEGMLDYRPTPKQRSTIELLRYLAMMGPEILKSIQAGSFLMEEWGATEARVSALSFAEVKAEIAGLMAHYATAVGAMEEAALSAEIEMFTVKASRARHLIDFIVCGHAAYRTQLFLYLKSNGREELGTMNLWAGVDG